MGFCSPRRAVAIGAYWLHDLDDWCREEGIPYREYAGWLTRSRSSGGFDQIWGAVAHHTGSNVPWQNDCAYMWVNASTRPVGNVHLDRAGVFTLGAAGATNTNGAGIANWVCSKGTIPIDPTTMGNRMAFAIEAASNGVGETWPRAQMDSYLKFLNMLARRFGWDPMRDINTHRGWAGTRKSDPFGPASGYPTLGTVTWPVPELRTLVRDAGGVTPSAPTLYHEVIGANEVRLGWSPPASDGGAPIIDYGYNYSPDGGATWVSGWAGSASERSTVVGGLLEGGDYLFRLTARNSVGWGAYSDNILVQVRRPPPPVGTHYVVQSGDGWIKCARGLGLPDSEWPAVQAANGGEQRQLVAGHWIFKPGFAYVVRSGDGWWAVVRGLGLDPAKDLAAVQARNGGSGHVLQPGEVIYAP